MKKVWNYKTGKLQNCKIHYYKIVKKIVEEKGKIFKYKTMQREPFKILKIMNSHGCKTNNICEI